MLDVKGILASLFRDFNSQRLIGGLITVVFAFLILMVLGLVPVEPPESDMPDWIVVSVLGMFLACGLLVLTDKTRVGPFFGFLAAAVVLFGFTVLLNWLAFGPGVRVCTRTVDLTFLFHRGQASDLECRIVAGLFAAPLDAILFLGFTAIVAARVGDRPWTQALAKIGQWGVLLSLAPWLLILAVVMLLTGAGDRLKVWVAKILGHKDPPPNQ